jgi:cytidine deaminase
MTQKKAYQDGVAELMSSAETARKNAYAPYSKFLVGAALELENGKIITGSNQENAAYPSGLCAERTAIFYAGAQFPNQKILKMAISAGSQENVLNRPIPPCGACRQALIEYEQKAKYTHRTLFYGHGGPSGLL